MIRSTFCVVGMSKYIASMLGSGWRGAVIWSMATKDSHVRQEVDRVVSVEHTCDILSQNIVLLERRAQELL